MRLLRAELSRLFARRFTKVMLLALVLSLCVIGAVAAADTHKLTAADVREARATAAQERETCKQESSDGASFCDEISADNYLPYTLDFRDQMPVLLVVYAGLLALLGYIVGASFVGVEASTGGLANLLLWRPQRVNVLLGKLTALLLGLVVVGVLIGAAWVAAVWTIARFRGDPGNLTQGFWISLGLDGARGLGLALLTGLAGAAIASLGRRTAAALGLMIGYLVVWEIGGRMVMQALRVQPDLYMLSSYAIAFLDKRYEYWIGGDCYTDTDCTRTIDWAWGLAVLGAVALVAVLVATVSFRRREVT
jgi:ABC-type transport system involved in multi-copper enzyme maturation permease subunit